MSGYAPIQAPEPAYDSAGDLWLTFDTDAIKGETLVVELGRDLSEVFHRTLPFNIGGTPLFAGDGLAYFLGDTFVQVGSTVYGVISTTPNAILEAPCTSSDSADMIAALSPQGDLRLLTYIDGYFTGFVGNADGGISGVLADGSLYPIDLSQRPKIACTMDVFTVGQRNE